MMNRRDLLLNQMNITQWVLTKPQVLKGDAQIRLDKAVKFVVICEQDQQKSMLFQDILRSLQLQPQQFQWLNLEQAMRLTVDHQVLFWLIQSEQQAVRFRKKFVNQTILHHDDWQHLHSSAIKRQFWQQIEPFCLQFEDVSEEIS